MAVVRALVFTVTSTGLALCAHHLASGQAVPGGAFCPRPGCCSSSLCPRPARRALPAVLAATGAGQAALHQFFAALPGIAAPMAPAVHDHGTGLGTHDGWHADHHHAVVMSAGQVVAALLVGWCLQRADVSCQTIARHLDHTLDRWLGRLASPVSTFHGATAGTGPVRPGSRPSPYNGTALHHTVVRRASRDGLTLAAHPATILGDPCVHPCPRTNRPPVRGHRRRRDHGFPRPRLAGLRSRGGRVRGRPGARRERHPELQRRDRVRLRGHHQAGGLPPQGHHPG
ncbi:hypothetical protein NKH18_48215 [Streptomyces sp. M10(2022)]